MRGRAPSPEPGERSTDVSRGDRALLFITSSSSRPLHFTYVFFIRTTHVFVSRDDDPRVKKCVLVVAVDERENTINEQYFVLAPERANESVFETNFNRRVLWVFREHCTWFVRREVGEIVRYMATDLDTNRHRTVVTRAMKTT